MCLRVHISCSWPKNNSYEPSRVWHPSHTHSTHVKPSTGNPSDSLLSFHLTATHLTATQHARMVFVVAVAHLTIQHVNSLGQHTKHKATYTHRTTIIIILIISFVQSCHHASPPLRYSKPELPLNAACTHVDVVLHGDWHVACGQVILERNGRTKKTGGDLDVDVCHALDSNKYNYHKFKKTHAMRAEVHEGELRFD